MKIEDILAQITSLQQKMAVYDSVLNHLENRLPSDTEDSVGTIRVEGPCMDPVVPVEIIDVVVEEVSGLRFSAAEELLSLQKTEIKEDKPKPRKRKR